MSNWKIYFFDKTDWTFELKHLPMVEDKLYGIAYYYIGSPHFTLETYDIEDFIPFSFVVSTPFQMISIFDGEGRTTDNLMVHCTFTENKDSIVIPLKDFIDKYCE